MPEIRDRVGDHHGVLVVVGPYEFRTYGKYVKIAWRCRCQCGNYVWVRGDFLTSGHHKGHCGCIPGIAGFYKTYGVKGYKLPKHIVRQVIDWREQGEKIEVIAEAFKLKYDTVAAILSRRKIAPIIKPDHCMPPNARRAW